jgi:Domain of unknown function (DUF5925)
VQIRDYLAQWPGALMLDTRDGDDLGMQYLHARWLSGELPAIRRERLSHVRAGASLHLPDGPVPCTYALGEKDCTVLQEAAGGSWVLLSRRSGDSAVFTVAAGTDEAAAAILARLTRGISCPPPASTHQVRVRFWWMSETVNYRSRTIGVIPWDEISGNYAGSLREPLGQMMKMRPADIRGRVILLHGPQGTGKTTLLRALGSAWRDWCTVSYILDPERALNNGAYIMQALLDSQDQEVPCPCVPGDDRETPAAPSESWRLIIMEDCGELITAGAKKESGQALSRLLNLADGILGQGCNLVFALTTNEPVGELHPALTRPGRALASLEVPPLPEAEAAEWLGRPVPPGADLTLAGLFRLRGDTDVIGDRRLLAAAPGQYL